MEQPSQNAPGFGGWGTSDTEVAERVQKDLDNLHVLGIWIMDTTTRAYIGRSLWRLAVVTLTLRQGHVSRKTNRLTPGSGGALPVLPLAAGRSKSLLDIVVAVVARRPFSRVVANSTLDQLASLRPLPNAAHSF